MVSNENKDFKDILQKEGYKRVDIKDRKIFERGKIFSLVEV